MERNIDTSISEVNRHIYSDASYSIEMKKSVAGTFGSRVRSLRRTYSLTQPALAKLCGIKQPSLSAIENDDTVPEHVRAVTLKALAKHLHTSEGYLVNGRDSPVEQKDIGLEAGELVDIFNDLKSDALKESLLKHARGVLEQQGLANRVRPYKEAKKP
jgi:transcriptional regulator with XRE-family HTH domain